MKERPIIYNSEMVRATLEGRKTNTRRPINKKYRFNDHPEKYKPLYQGYLDDSFPGIKTEGFYCQFSDVDNDESLYDPILCPYGQIGDRLWVREPAKVKGWYYDNNLEPPHVQFFYSDNNSGNIKLPKRFSRQGSRPKWVDKLQGVPNGCIKEMARIWLEITDIRVERVQDISEEDCLNEGIEIISREDTYYCRDYSEKRSLENWTFFNENEKKSFQTLWDSIYKNWNDNPHVWVIEFKRIDK